MEAGRTATKVVTLEVLTHSKTNAGLLKTGKCRNIGISSKSTPKIGFDVGQKRGVSYHPMLTCIALV